MSEHTHDIAIVGAGPAGSAAAYFLARGGLDVALIDKAAFPRDKTCGDGVSPRALHVLDQMVCFKRLYNRSRSLVSRKMIFGLEIICLDRLNQQTTWKY